MKNNLRNIRKSQGYSLSALGDLCGMSKGHICNLEGDKANPELKTAYKIASVLGKSVTDIWPNETMIEEKTITIRRVVKNNEVIS